MWLGGGNILSMSVIAVVAFYPDSRDDEDQKRRSPTRWYKSVGCDKQIYTVDSELFTPPAAFTIIYTHRIYNAAGDQNKDQVFTGDYQHNTGKTKVIINTTAVGKQRCESLKLAQMESTPRSILYKSLIQHSTAWSKSDQPFSRENPGSSGVNNVYAGTKHGWKQWQRCEPGLGKLTTEETRDCSLVFGKRCWAWLHQRQTLPRFPKWLLRSCFSAKCLFSPQNVC